MEGTIEGTYTQSGKLAFLDVFCLMWIFNKLGMFIEMQILSFSVYYWDFSQGKDMRQWIKLTPWETDIRF